MKKWFLILYLGCLPFILTCTIETVHNSEDLDPFIYPSVDRTWWIYQFYNLDIEKSMYDESYCRFYQNGTYEHPSAGTLNRLEYQIFNTSQQDWVISKTLFVQATDDSIRLYFDDSENNHLMLRLPIKAGDEWQVNSQVNAQLIGRGSLSVNHKFFNHCLKIEYSDSLSSGILWLASDVGGLGVRFSCTALSLLCQIQDTQDYDEAMLHRMGYLSTEI